ncbi:hypothetical protein PRIPAC_75985 [Pristionchus pacificus]|uniref:Uncharacterized protein n=1 Tax=Pristionchus pacificus TaxID=54126 RepID=A0A454Y6H8_PRIPA|nr:hypothetical protein PRIPAC_75985 [Pristionchus pacificus]|eukprot:PDM76813.1 hypothetical protein PRIPAC_42208 [Pristionchus pacificus]
MPRLVPIMKKSIDKSGQFIRYRGDKQLGDKFPPLAPCPSDAPPAMRREFAELELLEQQYEALLLQDEKAAAAAAAADPSAIVRRGEEDVCMQEGGQGCEPIENPGEEMEEGEIPPADDERANASPSVVCLGRSVCLERCSMERKKM